jgi:hypothetical protein
MRYADKLKGLIGKKGYFTDMSGGQPYVTFTLSDASNTTGTIKEVGDDYITIHVHRAGRGTYIEETLSIPLNMFILFH